MTYGLPTRRGFTLIELLVVIAIIAILAAILFPVFAQAKESAKKTQGLAQMKQIGTAANIYASDFDDALPAWHECFAYRDMVNPQAFTQDINCNAANLWAAPRMFDSKLSPYVKNGNPQLGSREGIWKSPGREGYVGGSIGMHQLAMWEPASFFDTTNGCQWGQSTNRFTGCYFFPQLGRIENPSEKLYLGDTGTAIRLEPNYFLNGYGEEFVPTYAGYRGKVWGRWWRYGRDGANHVRFDTSAKFIKGDILMPSNGRAPSFTMPAPVNIAIHCAAARFQSAYPETQNFLRNYVANTLGGNCPN
jgi:prepilin-type N-terminal cleavage/methylation domain-containing protein